MRNLAPIALFAYNRPELIRNTLHYLSKNILASESLLYIYCDGPKASSDAAEQEKIREVRQIVRAQQWCGEVKIVEAGNNKGLADSIINGVSTLVQEFGKVIVVEDDLALSPYFLQYMNDALDLYEQEDRVLCIHGYMYPVTSFSDIVAEDTFFIRDPGCWGWATWKRSWELFEPDSNKLFDLIHLKGLKKEFTYWGGYPYIRMLKNQMSGKIDSWAIRWRAVAYLHDKLTLYPTVSLVRHEGNVPDATHHYTGKEDPYYIDIARHPVKVARIPVIGNIKMEKKFGEFLRKNSGLDIYSKIKKRIKRMFK